MPAPGEDARPLAYLDNCIVSRIADPGASEDVARATQRLAWHNEVRLVTSRMTEREVLQTANPTRAAQLHALVAFVPTLPWHDAHFDGALGAAPIGAVPAGGDWTHSLFSDLKAIFDEADALHIFQAAQHRCRYFVTLDGRTILRRVKGNLQRVAELCPGLSFVSPSELLEKLETAAR